MKSPQTARSYIRSGRCNLDNFESLRRFHVLELYYRRYLRRFGKKVQR